MLNEVTLKSAECLSISLAVPDGLDITKMKDTLKEEAEKQLKNLSYVSHNAILQKKYIYEITEVYPISDIVLIKRVDKEITDELELTDKQFIVNDKIK
jgi:hypothetical protein